MNNFNKLLTLLCRKAHLPAVALLALLFGFNAHADVTIDETTFPDENFRNHILSQTYGADGVLTDAEIANIGSLGCNDKNISSLKGIEYLTALTDLYCNGNNLTELDLSNFPTLKLISCDSNNPLTTLNVSNCTALELLDCDMNPQLTTINVSGCTALKFLSCAANNSLATLDVSSCTGLELLQMYSCQVTSLDVSKNTALEHLSIGGNKLTSLDVSNNPALKIIGADRNQLTSIDLSKNTALEELYCSFNPLTSLDMSNNTALKLLQCINSSLTTIDVSKNIKLVQLRCANNQLTSLDVSNNSALENLWCNNNQLTTLDLSKNPMLDELWCQGNQLTELDLSNNTALSYLSYKNQTRTLTAESAVTPEGERYYYLPLGNYVNGVKSIVERMTETNLGGVASKFDLSKVLEWTSGGHVSGVILLLTDVTEDPTTKTASGTVKYKYNVNNSVTPEGDTEFTLNWTAPMPEGSTSGPAALELNESLIRLQITQSYQLKVETPNAGEITWTSSNPEVVQVDSTGRITAIKNGTAIVKATTANGLSAWCGVWSYLRGDLNEDNKVDVADLNEELNIIITQ